MSNDTLVSVSCYTKWSDVSDIQERGRFEYIPAVAFTVQTDPTEKIARPELLSLGKPFSLWELGLPIELLCAYAKEEIGRKEELKVARRAYQKLKSFANRCADRILADLICALLLKTWTSDGNFLYFIEGPPSDKMLARLAYLYPSLENLTICFISFQPSDLITSVMSYQTGKLEFDIHRLMSVNSTVFLGPYPGTSDESLIQTYFFRHPEARPGKKVSPLRIDIFGQGLLESDMEKKKEGIEEKLRDGVWVAPYPIEDPIETILPKGLIMAIDSWKINYDRYLESILKGTVPKESDKHGQ